MKKRGFLQVALILAALVQPCRAYVAPEVKLSVDVLSDTRGANLAPYLQSLVAAVKRRWNEAAATLPAERGLDHRETVLELTVGNDGRLLSLRQQGTESDELWSHAAWEAAKGNTYAALPASLKGANLNLRLHFQRLQ